jgi:hypothetical protein
MESRHSGRNFSLLKTETMKENLGIGGSSTPASLALPGTQVPGRNAR